MLLFNRIQTRWNHFIQPAPRRGRTRTKTAPPALEPLEPRALLATVTEYPITGGQTSLGNGLFGITGGPDGKVYFTDTIDNSIGRITSSGTITQLPLSSSGGGSFFGNGLDGITLGSNGQLVFTESTQGAIGMMTTGGSVTTHSIGTSNNLSGQGPDQITTASDGALWWTEDNSNAIGELTGAGVFHQYAVPNAASGGIIGASLKGITIGPNGNLWFTNWGSSVDFIGEMTPGGSFSEYSLPFGTDPVGITSGPDGNLWFTAYGTNTIDQMSTSGVLMNQYSGSGSNSVSGLNSNGASITVGSDKNLYFSEASGNIGEITTAGVVTITPVSTTVPTRQGASGPQPYAITSGPDGNIWFTDPWTDSIGVLRIAGSSTPTPTPIPTPTPAPTATPTLTALSTLSATAVQGQTVTVTATVTTPSTPGTTPTGGTVTFSDQNGIIATETLVNGTASFVSNSLPTGILTISASYSGTSTFASSSTGTIITAAGNGQSGYSGDGGPATGAMLNYDGGLAIYNGNLYITQGNNGVVREVNEETGNITTVVGNGTVGYSGDGGPATDAAMNGTNSTAIDARGNIFMTDTFNYRIREVYQSTGEIVTIAGTGVPGDTGDNGPATSAELNGVLGIAVDANDNVYFADQIDNVIREIIHKTGEIITVAGSGRAGHGGDGGPATAAELSNPVGVTLDSTGNLFIADNGNNVTREVVKATGDIITVAGSGTAGYSGDGGAASVAKLSAPVGVAFDSEGDLFIGDSGNDVIREVVKATGNIITVAGNTSNGYGGDSGPANTAEFNNPGAVVIDSTGHLFIEDADNERIREVTPGVTLVITPRPTPSPTPSPTPTPTPTSPPKTSTASTETVPLVIAERAFFRRAARHRRPIVQGFQLIFNTSLIPQTATNASNYSIGFLRKKRIHHKTVKLFVPISGFRVSYVNTFGTNVVDLVFLQKQRFPKGGLLTIAAASPSGIESTTSTPLKTSAIFAITPGGKTIRPE